MLLGQRLNHSNKMTVGHRLLPNDKIIIGTRLNNNNNMYSNQLFKPDGNLMKKHKSVLEKK